MCVRGVLYHKRMYLRVCESCVVSQKDVFEGVRRVLYHKRMCSRVCERCVVSQKDVFESV